MFESKTVFANQKGGALVYVILAAFGLGILSYLITERARATAAITARSNAEKELEKLEQIIVSYISSPSECNAIFTGLPRSTGVTGSPQWQVISAET